MRFFTFLCLVSVIFSCSNDISSIGQNLIDDNTFVEIVEYRITDASTIQLDSFDTSVGYRSETINSLLIGQAEDPITGFISARPHFGFTPTGFANIPNTYVYDSITMVVPYNGLSWGDTTNVQTFHLHRLKELPILNSRTHLLYDHDTVPYEDSPIASISVLPRHNRLNRMYFKIDDELGRELFEMIRTNDHKIGQAFSFVRYMKGFTIIPDPANTCLLGMHSQSDTLFLKVHYHDKGNKHVYSFNNGAMANPYVFTHFSHQAIAPYDAIDSQFDNLAFQDAAVPDAPEGQLLSQGLNGYMIKMRLPIPQNPGIDQTLVKAEIEMGIQKSSNLHNFGVCDPGYVFKSDANNKLLIPITDGKGNAITANITADENYSGQYKYVINISDYYNTLASSSNASNNNYIIVSVPLSKLGSSFDKMVVNKFPILKVYYAKYE